MPPVERGLRATLLFLLLLMPIGLVAAPAPAANALTQSSSHYLAQFIHSPIHWHPWGDEPLARAKQEQKLIFLSIGAAACQQCRLMDQESFRDPATVDLLNDHFISIRLDRDEHPDLDSYFRLILGAMTGKSAWPLQMILTPDLQPIYGGSYFPLQAAPEQPTLKTLLGTLHVEWQQDRKTLLARLTKLSTWISEQLHPAQTTDPTDQTDPRRTAANFWRGRFDPQWGGIKGHEQQTPQPLLISLLLRQAATHRQPGDALPALLTLEQMASGGIRDQLAGAFFRLAWDPHWQVPIFDILLPDNALLARSYLEAFQLTGRRDYAQVAQEILDDLLQRMQLSGGCFATSISDDSHAAALHYTWTADEIRALLGPQAESFLELSFDPVAGGVAGRSVLRLLAGLETMHAPEWQENRQRLRAVRAQRPALFRDEKVITSWNALTISVLAQAGTLLQQDTYLAAARTCLTDLQRAFPTAESVRHSRWGNRHSTTVFLDDYAFLAQALLDLYAADFSPSLLEQAEALLQEMVKQFQSLQEPSLLTLTPNTPHAPLPARTLWEDGPYPSGLSVALVTLQRIALLQQGGHWEKWLNMRRPQLHGWLGQHPHAAPELLRLWDYLPESAIEVVIVGERNQPETQSFIKEVRQRLLPGLVLVQLEPEQKAAPAGWPLLNVRPMLNGKPTAYVCRQQVCRMPVNRLSDLVRELDGDTTPLRLLPTPP
ncbi:MAG: thioredoxin domain-containing protein [Magnetococcales bacterium]|nr:thioredoxin domain-containing protein [Magnetococcales bacterium]MBF0115136.1 thioredoxin domain-containing protein [Magnetococcales bacterium]